MMTDDGAIRIIAGIEKNRANTKQTRMERFPFYFVFR